MDQKLTSFLIMIFILSLFSCEKQEAKKDSLKEKPTPHKEIALNKHLDQLAFDRQLEDPSEKERQLIQELRSDIKKIIKKQSISTKP